MSTAVMPLESIVQQSMRRFGERCTVFSYHFMPIKEVRPYKSEHPGGYTTTYKLAAVKDRTAMPSQRIILDAYERVYKGTDMDVIPPLVRWEDEASNTTARLIADDIVHCGTGSSAPVSSVEADLRPGVWVSGVPFEKLPHGFEGEPTWGTSEFKKKYTQFLEECEFYREREYRWCEKKVEQGDTFHTQGIPREITEIHRGAAAWIGANPIEHKWMEATSFNKIQPCPFCGAATSIAHPICGNCNRVVDPELLVRIEKTMGERTKRATQALNA